MVGQVRGGASCVVVLIGGCGGNFMVVICGIVEDLVALHDAVKSSI